jgi:hypothetical protein
MGTIVEIAIGFAAVGMLSMRGMLGYAGWRWLFLIEGAFTCKKSFSALRWPH